MPAIRKSNARSEQDTALVSLDMPTKSKSTVTRKDKPIKSKAKTASTGQDTRPKPAPKVNIPVEVTEGEPTQALPTKKRSIARDDAFEAMLNPFYYGKSLTDPINTAKVCQLSTCHDGNILTNHRTNGTCSQHSSRSKVWSNNT